MKRIALLVALSLTLSAQAAEQPVQDPASSEFGFCITCHGVNGRGNPGVNAPRIGGMDAWYIEQQLNAFRKEWRGTHPDNKVAWEMQPMALAISADQVPEAAAWFAGLGTPAAPDTITGDAVRGEALYSACAVCHGAAAEGNQALSAPALAGQSDWYLVRQINDYKQGTRGYAAGDTLGQQMRAMVTTLADEQAVRDLVAYINSID